MITPNFNSNKPSFNSNKHPNKLSKLIGQKLEITHFIGCLASCNPESLRTFKDLAEAINKFSLICSETYASINCNLVMNLILKQFPDPLLDGIRELISNANDANQRKIKMTGRNTLLGVKIELEDDTLSITDEGDGIGFSNLRKFFVPGCSSNKTLSDINEGIQNVTGRFGQGSFAAYFSLIPPSSVETIQKLEFIEGKDTLKLIITCLIDGVPHQVTSTSRRSDQGPKFETSYEPLVKPVKRKISVHSWREGDEAIKMKFCEVKDQILLDMAFEPKKEIGTIYKISSPVIKANESKITDHIKKVFKSVSYPITLNGILINDTIGKKLNFDGGYLSFTPMDERYKENVNGLLRICESECLILDFPLQDFLVPKEVTINFDRLALSQERASIDFKNSQTLVEMESLIETIVQGVSLSSLERNALLNALSPIIGSNRFNLTNKICVAVSIEEKEKPLTSNKSQEKPSEVTEILKSNEDKSLYLNPVYFTPNDRPTFFEGKNYFLYSISSSSEEPLTVLKKDDVYHLFINEKLFVTEHLFEFEFNLHLLNLLLKNKGHLFSIEVSDVIAKKCGLTKKLKKIDKEELSIPEAPLLDWESYDNVPKSETACNGTDYCLEFSSKYFYPHNVILQQGYERYMAQTLLENFDAKFNHEFFINKSTQKELEFFIENQLAEDLQMIQRYWTNPKSIKHLKYFCDILVSKDESFSHFREFKDPLFFKFLESFFYSDIKVKNLHELIYEFYIFCRSKTEEEKNDYLLFFSYSSWLEVSDDSFIEKFREYRKVCEKILQIITICNCNSRSLKENIFKKWWQNLSVNATNSENNFEMLCQIALRLSDTSAAKYFLSVMHNLPHLEHFERLSQKQLENFFNSLSSSSDYLHKDMSIKDYENIHWLCQNNEMSKPAISKWVELYCMGSTVMFLIFPNPKTGILKELIDSYLNLKSLDDLEDLSLIVQKMTFFLLNWIKLSNLLQFLCDFERGNKELLSKMEVEERNQFIIEQLLLLDVKQYKFISILNDSETLEYLVESYNIFRKTNDSEYNEFFRKIWERLGWISTPIRPFIYALIKKENLIHANFIWPIEWTKNNTLLMHKDKDIIELLGSEEVAEGRLRGVVAQTTEKNMFVKEFCKNSSEAEASEIRFEVHSNEMNQTIVSIKDNGKGMDLNDLKVFKTPNYSTKSQNGNFGQGAMTGLAGYDEMVVTTSKDGVNAYQLAIKKTPQGLVFQVVNSDISHPIGTTILLKKEHGQVLVDLVNLEAELVSSCQYFKGIEIFFQNAPINKESKLIVLHEEIEDGIQVQLGKGEEGIYCNDMRMSSLGDEYTSILPKGAKEMLEDNKVKLRVFLPHTNQVMNRNFLLKENSALEKIQALIFSASINYYVKQWVVDEKVNEGNKEKKERESEDDGFLKVVSADYWDRLDRHRKKPSEELLRTIEAIQKRDWSLFTKNEDYKQKEQLVQHSLNFFKVLKDSHELSFDNNDKSKCIEDMLTTALIKEEERLRNQWLQSLKSKFTEPWHLSIYLSIIR